MRPALSDHSQVPDDAVRDLLLAVGERVRRARARQGIPRRALSDMSGVSQRYLAQLESGEGNISIGLLKRVALALDHKIEWLVGDDDPWSSEALGFAEMFRAADEKTRDGVMALLRTGGEGLDRASRLCLLGMRGAGKSTLGQKVAEDLGVPFIELNREIENQAGMPTGEIMEFTGQEGYRRYEAEALDRIIATHDRLILAAPGGIVSEPATYSRLLARFHTIWIKTSAAEHMDRVRAQGDERPMAGNPEAMAQLSAMLASREPLYDWATAKIDTSGASVDQSVAVLTALIAERGFLSS